MASNFHPNCIMNTTVRETANYLEKQKANGWVGSSSIHPRVVNGRAQHAKTNTCAATKKK